MMDSNEEAGLHDRIDVHDDMRGPGRFLVHLSCHESRCVLGMGLESVRFHLNTGLRLLANGLVSSSAESIHVHQSIYEYLNFAHGMILSF